MSQREVKAIEAAPTMLRPDRDTAQDDLFGGDAS